MASDDHPLLAELIASIADSPLPFVVTDPRRPGNPIVAVNAAFTRLTLYEPDEAVGRNPRFLQGPDSDNATVAAIRAAVAAGRTIVTDIVNYRKDGAAFRNAMMIAPVHDDSGALVHFIGSQLDLGLARTIADRHHEARLALGRLSPRQAAVLRELARGRSNKQIAFALSIGEKTVRMHRALLLERLGVGSLAEALRLAAEADC